MTREILIDAFEDSVLDKFGRKFMRKQKRTSTDLRSLMDTLRNQREVGFNDLLATLRKALESGSVPVSTTVAAYELLKRMKVKS